MSVWVRNLKTRLEDCPVVILHGKVRDKYIDDDGRICDNLTDLLTVVARGMPIPFAELIFYDLVDHEQRQILSSSTAEQRETRPQDPEFDNCGIEKCTVLLTQSAGCRSRP